MKRILLLVLFIIGCENSTDSVVGTYIYSHTNCQTSDCSDECIEATVELQEEYGQRITMTLHSNFTLSAEVTLRHYEDGYFVELRPFEINNIGSWTRDGNQIIFTVLKDNTGQEIANPISDEYTLVDDTLIIYVYSTDDEGSSSYYHSNLYPCNTYVWTRI